jgi:aspartate beta-hydroxylase
MKKQYSHAMFSSLAPSTHIQKHHGPTNKKLRCHLPLLVPEGGNCRLRVGSEERVLREGEAIVFDDSYEHEAFNDDPHDCRVVLIVDMWHPDLHVKEIKFLAFLQDSSLKAEKKSLDLKEGEDLEHRIYDNFFSVIEKSRGLRVQDSQVF